MSILGDFSIAKAYHSAIRSQRSFQRSKHESLSGIRQALLLLDASNGLYLSSQNCISLSQQELSLITKNHPKKLNN